MGKNNGRAGRSPDLFGEFNTRRVGEQNRKIDREDALQRKEQGRNRLKKYFVGEQKIMRVNDPPDTKLMHRYELINEQDVYVAILELKIKDNTGFYYSERDSDGYQWVSKIDPQLSDIENIKGVWSNMRD